ncbi:MAG: hypothetical protein ACYC3L_06080 [Gemmatimonadaceae bacterium]
MSAFVNTLRVRPGTLQLGGADAMTVRVQLAEAWDSVAVEAGAATTLRAVKEAAFAVMGHPYDHAADYVMKLRGAELPVESLALGDSTARDGSTFILVHRLRQPVR